MGLIKNTDAHRIVSHGFEDLGDLRQQAEQELEDARAEARRIVDETRAQAETMVVESGARGHAEGTEKGLAEGRQEGLRQGRQEAIDETSSRLEELIPAWIKALEHFEAQRNDMLLAAREDILELALAMGGKITHRVIEANPNVVAEQVAQALALVAEPTGVTLLVNPEDRALVKSVLGEVLEKIGTCTHVDLRDEAEVGRGGCVVTTGKGRIDATVERQIERIVDALLARSSGRARKSERDKPAADES
jgi:flagellar biosynthesis/type III secretory pathway protein FliH